MLREDGWFGMTCWNGLSAEQQERLIEHGNLEFGYRPAGECPNGAEVSIETMEDQAPGPRFYCRSCAAAFLGCQEPCCVERRELKDGWAMLIELYRVLVFAGAGSAQERHRYAARRNS